MFFGERRRTMAAVLPYLIAALILLAAFLLMRLTLLLCDKATKRKILTFGKAAEDTVGALLISMFGADSILTNLYLPYRTRNGTAYTEVDCIAILRQGIVSIEVKSLVGTITNPDSKTWHQSRLEKDGAKELDFINPIWQNERHVAAIIGIMEKKRFTVKPNVINMVLFTSPQANFVYVEQAEIYRLPDAVRFLKEFNVGNALSKKDCRSIVRAIKKSAMPKRQAVRHNRKIRHDPM